MHTLDAQLVAMFTVLRRGGRRVLWNGDRQQPRYHALCGGCGWLSAAAPSIGEAIDADCAACAARADGTARCVAFVESVWQQFARDGHDGLWLAQRRVSGGRRVH